MIITVANEKGGVAKTTTAIHLAAYFQNLAPTLLIDGDRSEACIRWAERGQGMPFKIAKKAEGIKAARDYYQQGHIIIDTGANPDDKDFTATVEGCDLLIIPTVPQTTATDGLIGTLKKLKEIEHHRYRVLITMVPPRSPKERELREKLAENNVPVFASSIPRLTAFDTASANGVPVSAVRDEYAMTAWKAYESAGKEITNEQQIQLRRTRRAA